MKTRSEKHSCSTQLQKLCSLLNNDFLNKTQTNEVATLCLSNQKSPTSPATRVHLEKITSSNSFLIMCNRQEHARRLGGYRYLFDTHRLHPRLRVTESSVGECLLKSNTESVRNMFTIHNTPVCSYQSTLNPPEGLTSDPSWVCEVGLPFFHSRVLRRVWLACSSAPYRPLLRCQIVPKPPLARSTRLQLSKLRSAFCSPYPFNVIVVSWDNKAPCCPACLQTSWPHFPLRVD